MTVTTDSSFVPVLLQPFVILAKSVKGAACADLIKQATSANGVYTFTALLDSPNVQNVYRYSVTANKARWNRP